MLHSHPAQSSAFQNQRRSPWPRWPLLTLLSVLFLGPIIAPLFQATHMPLIADSGALARDVLSMYVCPTPVKSYTLFGFPMAVCARCWGATIGLWMAWLLVRGGTGGWGFSSFVLHLLKPYVGLPWPARLFVSALPFLLWPVEIVQWPSATLLVLLLNGAFAGSAGGMFLCSIWPGLWAPRSTTAPTR